MGIHAQIDPGGSIRIDHSAWLEQRTGGQLHDLTADLHRWARQHADTGEPLPAPEASLRYRVWVTAARSWAGQRRYELPEPDLIVHTDTRLDTNLWILRASIGRRGRIAVVSIDAGITTRPPTVYDDYCTDSSDWFDADTVDIHCPNGHGWTWRTGRELLTADGNFTTITRVFGIDPDAPFTPCPTCTAHAQGRRARPCGCGRIPWILCPTCRNRCDVELPTH